MKIRDENIVKSQRPQWIHNIKLCCYIYVYRVRQKKVDPTFFRRSLSNHLGF